MHPRALFMFAMAIAALYAAFSLFYKLLPHQPVAACIFGGALTICSVLMFMVTPFVHAEAVREKRYKERYRDGHETR